MTATTVPQADGDPCGYVTIGNLCIPVYNLKFTPPPQKPIMSISLAAQESISETEKLIRDYAATTCLDIATVRAMVNDGLMATPPVTPAESLAELGRMLNKGLVLHSTAAKGIPRAKLRQHNRENGVHKKPTLAPSKKRTVKERQRVVNKLREHRRKMAS